MVADTYNRERIRSTFEVERFMVLGSAPVCYTFDNNSRSGIADAVIVMPVANRTHGCRIALCKVACVPALVFVGIRISALANRSSVRLLETPGVCFFVGIYEAGHYSSPQTGAWLQFVIGLCCISSGAALFIQNVSAS